MQVKSESEVARSCPTLATPWTAAFQAPPSMGFSRQKNWSGVPLPSPFKKVDIPLSSSITQCLNIINESFSFLLLAVYILLPT